MSAIGNITLTDAAATPVNHTYYPQPVQGSPIAKWVDRAGGIALGFGTATYSLKAPTGASRAWKLQVKLVLPVLEVTSPSTSTGIQPAPTLAYNLIANTEIVLPERSTLQERKDLLAMARDLLSDAVVTSGVENFEPVW